MKTPEQIAAEAVKSTGLTSLYNDHLLNKLIVGAIEADRAQTAEAVEDAYNSGYDEGYYEGWKDSLIV